MTIHCDRTGVCSQTTLYGKRRENQHHGIDGTPGKGYPSGHSEKTTGVDNTESAMISVEIIHL